MWRKYKMAKVNPSGKRAEARLNRLLQAAEIFYSSRGPVYFLITLFALIVLAVGLILYERYLHNSEMGSTVVLSVRKNYNREDIGVPAVQSSEGYRTFIRRFDENNSLRTTYSGYLCPDESPGADKIVAAKVQGKSAALPDTISIFKIVNMEYKLERADSILWGMNLLSEESAQTGTELYWIHKKAFRLIIDAPVLEKEKPNSIIRKKIEPKFCDIMFHDVYGINGISLSPRADSLYILEYNGDYYSYGLSNYPVHRKGIFSAEARSRSHKLNNTKFLSFGWQGLDNIQNAPALTDSISTAICANSSSMVLIGFRNTLSDYDTLAVLGDRHRDKILIQAPAMVQVGADSLYIFTTAVEAPVTVLKIDGLQRRSFEHSTFHKKIPLPFKDDGEANVLKLVGQIITQARRSAAKVFYIEGIAAVMTPLPRLFICNREGKIYYLDDFEKYFDLEKAPWHCFDLMSGIPGIHGQDLAIDRRGGIWFATNNQIVHLGARFFTPSYRIARRFYTQRTLLFYLLPAYLIFALSWVIAKRLIYEKQQAELKKNEVQKLNEIITQKKQDIETANQQLRDREVARIVRSNRLNKSIIIGESPVIEDLRQKIAEAASSDLPVLLIGETGAGKELVAREIHTLGKGTRMPFTPVLCPLYKANELFRSEFFGHTDEAYTGAKRNAPGLVEDAENGTLFLDEIGDLALESQVMLLQFLDDKKTYRYLNDVKKRTSNTRIISATNQPLEEMIKMKKFREDLYRRLRGIEISVPALNSHKEDLPLLVDFFLHKVEPRPLTVVIENGAMNKMAQWDWTNQNVRELKHVIERAYFRVKNQRRTRITADDIQLDAAITMSPDNPAAGPEHGLAACLDDIKWRYINAALALFHGNQAKTAEHLKVEYTTLNGWIKNNPGKVVRSW